MPHGLIYRDSLRRRDLEFVSPGAIRSEGLIFLAIINDELEAKLNASWSK